MPIMCNASGVWKDVSTPTGGGTEVETGYLTKSATSSRAASTARWWKIGNLVIVRATANGYNAQDIQLPWSSTPANVTDKRVVGITGTSSDTMTTRTCTITTKCKITFSDSHVTDEIPMTFWLATVVTE